MPVILDENDRPVEIAPGRGDLRRSSVPFDPFLGAFGFGPFMDGRPISYAKIFATQPWVGIAVMRLLTWSVRVPLKVYRRIDSDEVERLYPKDHPLAAAVARPWEGGFPAQLTMNLLGPLLVHGNALLDVEQGARNALRMDAPDWRTVVPIPFDKDDPTSPIVGWKIGTSGSRPPVQRSADNVMHVRWWSALGQAGVSPLEMIRSTVFREKAAQDWTLNSLRQGMRPNGVVYADESWVGFDPAVRRELLADARQDLTDRYGGSDNAGTTPVLPPGLKWENTPQTTAVETELIDQRFVNRNEVAAVYQLPPPMIGQLDKATYSNISTQREMGYTDGLAPPLVMMEQQFTAHVCWGMLREDDIFCQYDFGHLLRGDRLKEIQAYREGVHSGIYAPDEARENLGMKKRGGQAGELHLPLNNLKPITGADATAPDKEEVEA